MKPQQIKRNQILIIHVLIQQVFHESLYDFEIIFNQSNIKQQVILINI